MISKRDQIGEARSGGSEPGTETGYQSTLQGEVSTSSLVPVALDDVMRIHKIPVWWIRSYVQEANLPARYAGLDIQLIVAHWSDQLVMHAPVLEKEIRNRLNWYQPAVDQSRHTISWRYHQNCGCPREAIPSDVVWEESKASADEQSQDSLLDHRGNIRV